MSKPDNGPEPIQRFTGQNMWSLLQMRSERSADDPFLIWHPFEGVGRTWTYAELARDAAALGASLQARGVQPGDAVLIHLENSPEFVIAWFGCIAAGAMAVTTNTRAARDELEYFIDHCGAAAAITQPKFADLVADCGPKLPWVAVTDHDSGVVGDPPAGPWVPFGELLADGPDGLVPVPADPMAPMSVQYTSGTTSRPKGVVWTNANGLFGARTNALHMDLRSTDCHLIYMPLFHTNALAYSMLSTLWVGARMVVIPKWSSSRYWSIVQEHGCTWVSLIPIAFRGMMAGDIPESHTLRMLGTGVCDLPFDDQLGVKTVGWWGMTETITQPIVGDVHVPNRPMSMGQPAPEYEIAVVKDDGVTRTDFDEVGDLLVRGVPGYSLFAEYLHDPEATAASFDEHGWFLTGDRVALHEDGHISFVDRSKDMLKVGAENVAASEIERVLQATGLIRESAIVGRPDVKLDEVAVAFVVPLPGVDTATLEDELIAVCAASLADFKVPREIYAVAEFPRSTINKVHKVGLRAVALPEQHLERKAAEQEWIEQSKIDPSGDAGAD